MKMPDGSNPKPFDCIEYKQRVQEEIYEEIKDLSPAQQLEYFHRASLEGPLAGWWKKVRENTARMKSATDPAA